MGGGFVQGLQVVATMFKIVVNQFVISVVYLLLFNGPH